MGGHRPAPTPGPPERILQVLPSREHVGEALRERVRAQGVALALGLIDLRSLEDRLLRACDLEPIGTTESRLALAAVAPAAARGTTLAELAREPGFAESFLLLWDTLRRAGIDAVGFERLAARLSRRSDSLTGRRFTALATIAGAYERALTRRGVVDGVGARARLPGVLADPERLSSLRLRALVDGADTLEIQVGGELPVIRARMWEALARRGLRLRVSVPELPAGCGVEPSSELAAAFELLRRNLIEEAPSVELVPRALIGDERDDGMSVSVSGQGSAPARAALLPFVAPARARSLVDASLRATLQLIDAGDERAELRAICAHARALIQSGVAPHRITVALPRLAPARQRVLAAFDAAELPVEESRGQPVIAAAPLRLTFALIEAAERELPREALAAVLESAYVARRDAPMLLAALRDAGSRDDRGVGHLGRLRAYAAKLSQPSPLSQDSPERRAAKAVRYLALADRWERLFERLRLPRAASLRGHLDAVFSALRALGIPRRCLSLPALGEGSRERRLERDAVVALARDRAALEALEIAGHGLDQAAEAVGMAGEAVSLADFRAHLEAALSGVRERPPGVRGAGIALRELSELAGARCDHLLLLHAVEGELPGPGRAIPFLDDEDRQALDRAAGRPVLAVGGGADAGSFALACAGVRGQLTISAHRQDHEGREVMRSRYVVALTAALEGPSSSSSSSSLQRLDAGVIPSLRECSTRGQVLTRLAACGGTHHVAVGDGGGAGEQLLREAIEQRPELGRAVDWARERAEALDRSAVALEGAAAKRAHTRLDFVWSGERASDGGDAPAERDTGEGSDAPPAPSRARLPSGPGLVWRGSATSLEDYAACPFRFYAARVLRLRPRPSTRDELTAAEQGSVRHEVLAAVMQALREAGLVPLEGGDQTWREDQLAHEVCDRILDQWQQLERTGPRPLWLLHRDLVHRDLGRVLEGERRVAIEGWIPGEFEVGFGLPDPQDRSHIEGVPLAIADPRGERRFELVGRVDRIDYRSDGREQEGLIIDYKSGRVGDRLRYDQLARTQLQLPLYAIWLASIRPELGDADAAYVSLRDGERSQASLLDLSLSSIELDGLLEIDPTARAALRARARDEREPGAAAVGPPPAAIGALDLPATGQRNLADNLWALLGGVAEARFDVRPHDPGRACRYCPYGAICRVERGDELDGGGEGGGA